MQIDLNYAAMQTKNHADKSGRIFFSNNFMIFGSSNFFLLYKFIGMKFWNKAQATIMEKKRSRDTKAFTFEVLGT